LAEVLPPAQARFDVVLVDEILDATVGSVVFTLGAMVAAAAVLPGEMLVGDAVDAVHATSISMLKMVKTLKYIFRFILFSIYKYGSSISVGCWIDMKMV
jgi:hypothetical protein